MQWLYVNTKSFIFSDYYVSSRFNSNNSFFHQAVNREMAPEYTDEQEEGEHVYHKQNIW